jgi:hypothetical protein
MANFPGRCPGLLKTAPTNASLHDFQLTQNLYRFRFYPFGETGYWSGRGKEYL